MKKLGLAVIWILLGASWAKAQDRPNILWLTYEDTSPQFLGSYGNTVAKTTFMDSLAKVGSRFTQVFSTGSVCSPSRTALITGMKTYTLGTGNHRSNYPIPEFVKGFPYYLKQAGYYCTNNAKTDYNVAETKAFIAEAWHESSNKAGWWNREEGQPFFAVFNFMSSHQSRTMTNSYEEYEQMVLSKLPKELQTSADEVLLPEFYKDSPAMRKHTARIYNSISLADMEMRNLFDRLQSEGLLENTIVFCFADHGEGMPRAKTNGVALGHQVPFIMYVPEKYQKEFSVTNGTVNTQLLDFCDLPPTVLDIAKVPVPEHFQGQSLFKAEHQNLFLSSDRSDESFDMTRTVIDDQFAYTRVFRPYIQELRFLSYMDRGDITSTIRKDYAGGKLSPVESQMLEPRPAEFLYDLKNDRWQTNNLALLKEYNAVLSTYRQKLKEHLINERDVMFLPETEMIRVSKTGPMYHYRLNNKLYPVKEIVDMAFLVGQDSQGSINKQKKALLSENEVLRFWAAIGLKCQPTQNIQPYLGTIKNLAEQDPDAAQVVLASIVSEQTGDHKALKKVLESNDPILSWMAVQMLLYQKNRADLVHFVKEIEEIRKSDKAFEQFSLSANMLFYLEGLQPAAIP